MSDDDRIVDKKLIKELQHYRDAYQELTEKDKASLLVDLNKEKEPTFAKALAEFLKKLNPEQTTYGQVRELAKLYFSLQHHLVACKVLKGFEDSSLFDSVPPPLTGLRPIYIYRVDQFLDEKAKSEVQAISKTFFEDNTRTYRLVQALLNHTIKGNQYRVVEMLKRYPRLLSYQGNVVDYSGRHFKKVSALQLAIWALDVRHMAPAMLKCLTENEECKDYSQELLPELQIQFDNFEKEGEGVNYTIGCGLMKMSQDPSQLHPGKTEEERYALLSREFDRRNGLIQFNDRIFYFHNLSCPKKLVEITDHDAVNALQGLINKKGNYSGRSLLSAACPRKPQSFFSHERSMDSADKPRKVGSLEQCEQLLKKKGSWKSIHCKSSTMTTSFR